MKIRSRVFLGILLVVGIGFAFLLHWITDDLNIRYRESTEEPLVDAARILAAFAAMTVKDGDIDVPLFRAVFQDVYSRLFTARIYQFVKTRVDFRVYITDATGTVLFDSDFDPGRGRGRDEGADYSQWRDVYLTLRGTYGARSTRRIPDDPVSGVMYVAAPIIVRGKTIGVLSVGKPVRNATQLTQSAQQNILLAGTATGVVVIIVGLVMSGMILRPIQRLTAYAEAVRDGKRTSLPPLGRSEIRTLGETFEEMRDALEGKRYVETYVQTLTHEIKSPVAAIQGAAELLKEDMPQPHRERFLHNILSEAKRIHTVIEKLLLLSSLENRKAIHEVETVHLGPIVQEVCESLAPLLAAKDIALNVRDEGTPGFEGERFLVRQAVVNLLQNAVAFTPSGGQIDVTVHKVDAAVELIVQDNGPGIPAYARERVFERFYSLPRPDTGKKSSGLGLSLVREVALLHGGAVHLSPAVPQGTVVRLTFPYRLAMV